MIISSTFALLFCLFSGSTLREASAAPVDDNSTLVPRQALAQVISSCTVPNTVALTFDDGPYDYIYVRRNPLSAPFSSLDELLFFLLFVFCRISRSN
jgi:hypothetical protein